MRPHLELVLYSTRLDRALLVRRVAREGQAEVHVGCYAGRARHCKPKLAGWAGPASEVAVFVEDECDGGAWLLAGAASFAMHDRAEAETLHAWLAITAPNTEVPA